jgi:uncharacterized protein YeaO (DUF488 family)
MSIVLQRIYGDHPQPGYRVLVDRVWPRGITKEKAALDEWCKEVAPSTELRKWFGHKADKWPEFRKRYLQELKHKQEQGRALLAAAAKKKAALVLLYGAKSEDHNHALVLKDYLETLQGRPERPRYASPPCYAHELDGED